MDEEVVVEVEGAEVGGCSSRLKGWRLRGCSLRLRVCSLRLWGCRWRLRAQVEEVEGV